MVTFFDRLKSEAKCFGFGRRRKVANAVYGNSRRLLPETKLSGLCADVVHLVFWLVHIARVSEYHWGQGYRIPSTVLMASKISQTSARVFRASKKISMKLQLRNCIVKSTEPPFEPSTVSISTICFMMFFHVSLKVFVGTLNTIAWDRLFDVFSHFP